MFYHIECKIEPFKADISLFCKSAIYGRYGSAVIHTNDFLSAFLTLHEIWSEL